MTTTNEIRLQKYTDSFGNVIYSAPDGIRVYKTCSGYEVHSAEGQGWFRPVSSLKRAKEIIVEELAR